MIKKNYSWFILFFIMVMMCNSGAMEQKNKIEVTPDQKKIFDGMDKIRKLADLEKERFMQLLVSPKEKETPEKQLRRISLGELRSLAGKLHGIKNVQSSTELLGTVAYILNCAVSHGVLFTDDEINPCIFHQSKGVFFQLHAADVGHAVVVNALAKHPVLRSDFVDDQGSFTMQQIVDVAARRSEQCTDLEQKIKYLETVFALGALRTKQEIL